MRPFLAFSVGVVAMMATTPSIAQNVQGRRAQVGPAAPPAFWVHDDGRVEVNDANGQMIFDEMGDYLASDWFIDNGRRCGLPPEAARPSGEDDFPADGVAGGSANDCTCNRTNPSGIYDSDGGVLYRIPVVVHVIQNSAGSQGYISPTCVQSQIDVLNEDFNAISGTPGAPGTDCKIEFFLATEDPNGAATDGITYSQNTTWFNDGGNYYNSLAWNTREYLNIYTNTASGALGYVPALGCANIDGQSQDRVVILYTAFGDLGCATASPYNRGRTATHEVGHYLGLEHTFSGGCSSQSNCNQNGDLVCDTLPQGNSTSNCSSSTSCGQSHNNQRNYMDYSVDSCMNNFTYEQQLRMRCVLEHYRVQLPCDDCGTAPENDECGGALPLLVGPNEGTTAGATTSGVAAPLICSSSSGPDVENDVWYTWAAPENGFLTVGTCGADFNSRIVVWNGSSCPSTGDTQVICSDDDCGDDAIATGLVLAGQQLVIQVGSPNGQAGAFTLDLQFDEITNPPANDDCSDRLVVGEGMTEFTTVDASGSGFDDPLSCSSTTGGQVFADVWFEWTAECTGFASISTCDADFNSRLSLFSGSCPSTGSGAIACADAGCGDDASISTLVLEGQTLLIRVGSPVDGDEGEGSLVIDCEPIGGPDCPEDINGDESVDAADLGLLIGAWGTSDADADINDDGIVDAADLGLLIGRWGGC